MRSDKFKAYKLRVAGRSYNEINRLLGVSKATLSAWFSNIELPDEARQRLQKRTVEGGAKKLIERNKEQSRIAEQRATETRTKASREIGKISKRDLFIVGVSLYWAEGH